MIPSAGDVKSLEDWSATDFQNWLGDGLADWFDGRGRRSFYSMYLFVDQDITIAADLFAIYSVLSRPAASRMRQGLIYATAFAVSRPVVMTLMDLAAMTKAQNLVSVIPGKLSLFATGEDENSKEFLTRALFAVASVSTNTGDSSVSEAAMNAIRHIVANKAFNPNFSGAVLTTLCRIKPERLSFHCHEMEPHLRKVYAINPESDDAGIRKQRGIRLIEEIHTLVGSDILYNSLKEIPRLRGAGMDWWEQAVNACLNNGENSNCIDNAAHFSDVDFRLPSPVSDTLPSQEKTPGAQNSVGAELLERFEKIFNLSPIAAEVQDETA